MTEPTPKTGILVTQPEALQLGVDSYAVTIWGPDLDGVFIGNFSGTVPGIASHALRNMPHGRFQLQFLSPNRILTIRKATLYNRAEVVARPGVVVHIEEIKPKESLFLVYPGDTYQWTHAAIEFDNRVVSRASTGNNPLDEYTGFEDYRESIREYVRSQI